MLVINRIQMEMDYGQRMNMKGISGLSLKSRTASNITYGLERYLILEKMPSKCQ